MSHNARIFALIVTILFISVSAHAQNRYTHSPAAWDQSSRNVSQNAQNSNAPDTRENNRAPYDDRLNAPYEENNQESDYQRRNLRTLNDIPARPIAHTKPSALEKMYSERIVEQLDQFGYDLFGIPKPETQRSLHSAANESYSIPSGAVQDDFVLDISDQLEVVFTGQRNDRDIYSINSQGMLLIKDFPPIPAAGRSIGQVRISIEAAARNFHNTTPYVSLASVRQIGVLVVGHVKRPGRQSLTVFHTVLDALMETGGVKKTGSLRQIKLVRDGRSQIIDIYSLLLYGAINADMQLHDGDRIVVPPIGPTVAIGGEVKRAGIYELRADMRGMRHKPETTSEKLSLNEMLELAGGVLVSGQNRFLKLSVTSGGNENVSEISDPFQEIFADGSVLMVSKGKEKRSGMVELTGHTRSPGIHALTEAPTLSALLPDQNVLGENIYPLIGVIERWDARQLSSTYIDFPLQLIIAGDYDRQLQEDDVIHLFSKTQIRNLNKGKTRKRSDQDDNDLLVHASYEPAIEQGSNFKTPEELENHIQDDVMAAYLQERAVFVRGAVRNGGHYPVASGVSLDNVLAVAGGLALEANTSNIEITSSYTGEGLQAGRDTGMRRIRVNLRETSPQSVMIGPGDSVRVNQRFDKITDKSVLIMGEVKNPGRYDLIAGDKVSDLIERAGGLTRQAYPDGAIFSRESERRAEESRFRAAARDLERALAISLEKDGGKSPNATQIAMARGLAEELREVEAVGRITVETDPGMLSARPELDMLLESGDRLFVPKRPLTVRVSGEILSPASLQFRDERKPLEYIHQAGGFTYHADKDRTFVLYPDGSAQPLQVNSWNYNPIFIPPGSTIVVPRDPKPFDFIQSAKDISQILSNLAITAIFLDDVRDD